MNVWLSVEGSDVTQSMTAEELVGAAGVWAPVICEREVERDYLRALCLMLGRDRQHCFLIAGEATNLDTPPTYLRIPHLN